MKAKHKPDLLANKAERSLRIILRSIARSNKDTSAKKRTIGSRVQQAEALLLGTPPPRGASPQQRDDILEMMAFYYSIELKYKKSNIISIESIAKASLDMPGAEEPHSEESLIKDLVRKFTAHKDELLLKYSYDSPGSEDSGNIEEFYTPIMEILTTLERIGIKVDYHQIPPSSRQGRNIPHISPKPAPK